MLTFGPAARTAKEARRLGVWMTALNDKRCPNTLDWAAADTPTGVATMSVQAIAAIVFLGAGVKGRWKITRVGRYR